MGKIPAPLGPGIGALWGRDWVHGPVRLFRFRFFLLLALSCAARGIAQEISFLAGGMSTLTTNRLNALVGDANETSYAWQLDFRHQIDGHFAWSASWLNEGHTQDHHRDGFATQFWTEVLSSGRLELAVGLGGYRYFDTLLLDNGETLNAHGWTPIGSASLTYYTDTPWFFRLSANRVNRTNGLGTNTLLLGAGYELRKRPLDQRRGWPRGLWDTTETPAELTAFFGKSIVNTGASEDAVATAVEFRKGLAKNFDWTVSWINEGDPKIIRRNGLAAQIWAVDEYFARRFSVGFGAGGYWYFDQRRPRGTREDHEGEFAALLSPTLAYRFSPRWQARLTWNRVLSHYDRDADVILLGFGRRWAK